MKKVKKTRKVNKSQHLFVNSEAKFPALVGGKGSGKTEALALRALRLLWKDGQNIAYYLPTYGLISDIAYPRFMDLLTMAGIPCILNKQNHEISIAHVGKIIFRSLDNPDRIIGYEVGHSFIDEFDILTMDKAKLCWQRINDRNRTLLPNKALNTVSIGTTPEGFRFVYINWFKVPIPGSVLIRASTYQNMHNLPPDYIETFQSIYPEKQLDAYLYGHFVNLTSGRVYNFNAQEHGTFETIQPNEPLHIGMDFNVENMHAVVHVLRNGVAYALDEFTKIMDTKTMIQVIKNRYPRHQIIVYPDPTGKRRLSADASVSDIIFLRKAGFRVVAKELSPFIKDRVQSFCNALEKEKYFVNTEKCPVLKLSLEQQAYDKNGKPDKNSGFDHVVDAAGYFVYTQFPIKLNIQRRSGNFLAM